MTGLFKKYVEEGKGKIVSLQERISKLEYILHSLSEDISESGVELEIESITNAHGVGFKTELSSVFYTKKFITVTIPKSEREVFILEKSGDVETVRSIDNLISKIGDIISSVPFWHEIEELKRMDSLEQES